MNKITVVARVKAKVGREEWENGRMGDFTHSPAHLLIIFFDSTFRLFQ